MAGKKERAGVCPLVRDEEEETSNEEETFGRGNSVVVRRQFHGAGLLGGQQLAQAGHGVMVKIGHGVYRKCVRPGRLAAQESNGAAGLVAVCLSACRVKDRSLVM